MSIKITGLTRLSITSLAGCLTPEESARVTFTQGTATFAWVSLTQAIAVVLQAQARHPDRGCAAYHSIDAIVRKLRALADPPEEAPAEVLTYPEVLQELDRLETLVAALSTVDNERFR